MSIKGECADSRSGPRHDPVTAKQADKKHFQILSKLRKIDQHELTLLGCLLCLQVLACILTELLQRQTAGTQISGSLMRMYAHLLRNTCKIL